MKIKIEIDDKLNEDEITIRCRELNDQIEQLQRAVREIGSSSQKYVFQKGESQYYLSLHEILFFEADDHRIYAHTKNEVYETRYKLYELEKLLPSYFLRVSKSTVLNMREVLSIRKNITSASMVEFRGSDKKTYVSRSYYKLLEMRMEELYLRGTKENWKFEKQIIENYADKERRIVMEQERNYFLYSGSIYNSR